ncbi:glycosyltransferase family 4 protein [Phocaeicola sp.]
MRILWFTNTPSNYVSIEGYNGGGWISSLENELKKSKEVELGISFWLENQSYKIMQDRVVYYPISTIKVSKMKRTIMSILEKEDRDLINKKISCFLDIVNDFNPDIIHVFGSEQEFGLISKYTSIPVVLHIQGILNPCFNAFLPPFISWRDYYFSNLNPISVWRKFIERIFWRNSCKREMNILGNVKYYLGRTEWDQRVIKIYNERCEYYHCNEILRDDFYNLSERHLPSKLTIVSTISAPLYKGFDLILKTANILKNILHIDFEWMVFGNIDPAFAEKRTDIKSQDVNVLLMGVVTAAELKNRILNCTLFIYPSYIDNSPNSLCEAQMLGCCVVSTNVGGISSLIEDGKSGFLVPANDPFQISYLVKKLYYDKELNISIGNTAREVALQRHCKEHIIDTLLDVYGKIIRMEK